MVAKKKETTEDVMAKAKRLRDEAREAAQEAKRVRDEEKAKRKEERAKTSEARKAEREAKKNQEPDPVEQKDEHGNTETVDKNKNPFPLVCPECGETRWLTLSQTHEVTHCKPCARKLRRKRRIGRIKDQQKNHKAIVAEAIKQGLFPQSFREKWGI